MPEFEDDEEDSEQQEEEDKLMTSGISITENN